MDVVLREVETRNFFVDALLDGREVDFVPGVDGDKTIGVAPERAVVHRSDVGLVDGSPVSVSK